MISLCNLFRREKPTGLGQLCNLFVLSTKDRHCDKCDLEGQHCFKLHFSNQTICVCPKDSVTAFSTKKKTRK